MAKRWAFWAACLILMSLWSLTANGQTGEIVKNGHIASVSEPVSADLSSVPPGLAYGTRIRAIVNYPSDSECIVLGDVGTVFCYDAADSVLPYLVNWDNGCGFEQSGCGVTASNGWWVGFDEIETIADTTPVPTRTPTTHRVMGDSWNLPLVLNGGSQATATPTSSTPTPSAVATMTVTPTASDPGQVVLSSVADTMISSNHASQNFGSTIDMWVGFDDNAESLAGIVRSLVRFDLASVPAGATVTSATLRLYHKSSWDYPDRSRPARAYRAQDAWNELSSTWDNQPAFSDGYGSVAIVHGDYGWVEMSVTDLVQAWLDGSHANHGIVVRGDENTSADSGHRDFYTREADGTTYAPQLVVVYQ